MERKFAAPLGVRCEFAGVEPGSDAWGSDEKGHEEIRDEDACHSFSTKRSDTDGNSNGVVREEEPEFLTKLAD